MFVSIAYFIRRLDIPNNGKNNTARLFNWFTLAIGLIATVYACGFAGLIGRFDVTFFGICAVVLSVGVNLLARHDHIHLASFIFIAGIWFIIMLANLAPDADGVYDAAFTAYIIPILLAGFLLGNRASFVFAILSTIVGLGFLIRSLALPVTFIEARSSSQVLHFTAESLFFLIAAALFTLTNRSLTDALKRAQISEENLLMRNRELEREVFERQQVESTLRFSDQMAKQFQDDLKALHEVSIQLATVTNLDELFRQAVVLGRDRLRFDRLGWLLVDHESGGLRGTYGTDTDGNLRNDRDLTVQVSLANWTNTLHRFSANGDVYFLEDTDLKYRNVVVGRGWNAYAAVPDGDEISGWIVADNLLNQKPLEDFQLEILRLYGAILGQLFVQKQTQQMLSEKDNRLQLALHAAHMRTWDWNIQTGVVTGKNMYEHIAILAKSNYVDFVNQIHPDDQNLVLDAVRKMIEHSGIYEVEYRIIDNEGDIHWFYTFGQPYLNENGEIAGVAGVLQDISGRKAIEASLKRAEQQGMDLALQRERIKVLTEFINTVSHDFKTPLAIINNSLYLLERINDPVKQRDKLDLIRTQTMLLDKQIQDILTISRLEYALEMISRPVNINGLLNKIADLFQPSFENKNQTLHIELQPNLPNFLADPDELDRVFVNLIENAINYTPIGGSITISTRLIDDHIECAVTDTGIGMSALDTHQIFNNFYRAENARMINSKGTGLGLAIVKRIVTNHNGSINVESELGKGTSFRLRFPMMVNVQ